MGKNINLNSLIGKQVKYIRKKEKKTLKILSAETGLSVGYLSNLERNIISPTIDQLQKICAALNVNITNIMNENVISENPVIRSNERPLVFNNDEPAKYELLSQGKTNDIEGICITMQVGADYEKTSWGHSYDELGFVVKGTLSVELLDAEYILKPGDSIYIKKNSLHTFRNAGKCECISCWFYSKK